MINALLLAAVSALGGRAQATPERLSALRALAAALPADNPDADQDYMPAVAAGLPGQLASCRYEAGEMDSIDRILAQFDAHLGPGGDGKAGLLEALKHIPEFEGLDGDPAKRRDYDRLALGIRLAPDITKGKLMMDSCRALLRMHFTNGASRDELARAVEDAASSLEQAP